MRTRSRGATAAWLLLAAVCCAALIVAVYVVFVHTTRGQWVDDAALRGTTIGRQRIIAPVSRILNLVSVSALGLATITVGVVAFLRRRPRLALLAMLLVIGANLTTEILKHLVFDRPALDGTDRLSFSTLPSGHTTVAMSVAVAVTLVAPSRLRALVGVVGVLYGGATGVAVLSAGWHRPSDAVASCLVVGMWTAVIGALAVAVGPDTPRPRQPGDTGYGYVIGLMAGLGTLLLLIGTAALIVTAYSVPEPSTRPRLFVAYAGGASAVAGAALAVMAALLYVARTARTDDLDSRLVVPELRELAAHPIP